jgi:hypothetical protein
MPTPEHKRIPDWARRERRSDFAWIQENFEVFWLASRLTFDDLGRGAIVVDTTVQPLPDAGHPFAYFAAGQFEEYREVYCRDRCCWRTRKQEPSGQNVLPELLIEVFPKANQ